jgi:hypothetical protein
MAALVFGLVFLVIAGLSFALGVGWLAVIPLVLALGVVIWGAMMLASGRSPTASIRQTPKAELLGPGGPDDPDRNRR